MFMLSPPRVKLPALTWMMLVPADLSEVSTDPRAPVPSATMAITAATPITTPSMVRQRAHAVAREGPHGDLRANERESEA